MTHNRKGSLKFKLHRHDRAALFFSKLNGRKTISFENMKKGIACGRGISTKWMFHELRHSDRKDVHFQRRYNFESFLENLR